MGEKKRLQKMRESMAKAAQKAKKKESRGKDDADGEEKKKYGRPDDAKFGAIGKIDFSKGYWKARAPVLEDRSFRLSVRALSVFCEPLIIEHSVCTHYLMGSGLGVVVARAFGQPVVQTIGAVWASVCRFLKSEVAEDSPFLQRGMDPSNFVDMQNNPLDEKTIDELQRLGRQTTRAVKTLLDFPLRTCALKIRSQIPHGTQQLAGMLSSNKTLMSWATRRSLELWQAVVSLERYGRSTDTLYMDTGVIRDNQVYRTLCSTLESELQDLSLLNTVLNLTLDKLAPATQRLLFLLFEKSGNNSKSVEDVFSKIQKYAQQSRGATGRIAYSRLVYLTQASQTTNMVIDLEKQIAGDEAGKLVCIGEDDGEEADASEDPKGMRHASPEFEFHEDDKMPKFVEFEPNSNKHERPARLEGDINRERMGGNQDVVAKDHARTDEQPEEARKDKARLLQESKYFEEEVGIDLLYKEINTFLVDNRSYNDIKGVLRVCSGTKKLALNCKQGFWKIRRDECGTHLKLI